MKMFQKNNENTNKKDKMKNFTRDMIKYDHIEIIN